MILQPEYLVLNMNIQIIELLQATRSHLMLPLLSIHAEHSEHFPRPISLNLQDRRVPPPGLYNIDD